MERQTELQGKVTKEEDQLRQEIEEFIKELKTPERLFFMTFLDEALPQLQGIHETLKELNEEFSQKLSELEQL